MKNEAISYNSYMDHKYIFRLAVQKDLLDIVRLLADDDLGSARELSAH